MKRKVGGLFAVGLIVSAFGCGIAIRRDLSTTKPQLVLADDMCGLQEYFDTLALHKAEPPNVVSTNELERTDGKRVAGGRTRFSFTTAFQRKALMRVLDENWKRIPEEVTKSERVDIEVLWAEKAGVRRVVTDREAAVIVGEQEWPLPYHQCLADLLYGEQLYKTRHEMFLGLPPLVPVDVDAAAPAPARVAPAADAGATPAPAAPTTK